MFNWKKKMLAQRKFAQGTVVNQPASNTTSASTERRAVPESNDRSVHIYSNNTSASRLLDEIVFRNPGMHVDNCTIKLTRLPESVFNKGRVIIPSTSTNTVQENPFDHCLEESQCVEVYHHTYFLRSCSKLNNVTKKVVPNTQPNIRATSKKRGRPKKSALNRVKPKRLISPVYSTCSEDEQPLSQYHRSKKRITPPYIPRNNDEDCAMLDTSARSNLGNNDEDCAMLDTSARSNLDSTNVERLVSEDDVEEGNNNGNGAMIDTSEDNFLDLNNTGPFVYRDEGMDGKYITINTSLGKFILDRTDMGPLVNEDEEEGNNDVNGAMIDTSVGDFTIGNNDVNGAMIDASVGDFTIGNNDVNGAMTDTSVGDFTIGNNDVNGAMIDASVGDFTKGNNDVNGAMIDASVGDFTIGNNNVNGAMIDTSVGDFTIGNNNENGAMIDTSVEDLTIDNEDINEPINIPSEGSEDYKDDLSGQDDSTDDQDVSDITTLASEESSHEPDVTVVPKEEDVTVVPKEEDRPTTSNERSHRAIAGPSRSSVAIIEDAPVYHPTEEEFNDPMVFYSKVRMAATKYGICKVVPPEGFEPKCCMKNLTRVSVTHQYIGRLFKRWGPGTREMCAIRAQLASYTVVFTRPPLIHGLEVDLPKMFHTVQKYGGFLEVNQKQLWTRVAEDMNYFKILNPGKRLDQIYLKYLLPYDMMKSEDRALLHSKIESVWEKKHQKLLKQARNPVQLKDLILGDSDSSSDEEYTSEEENINKAMFEIPNNDKSTRPILLTNFQKTNHNACRTFFPQNPQGPPVNEAEDFYWSKVSQATDHICIYTASVDTADGDHGFSTEGEDVMSKHKWNLKNFQHNEANVLKSLGPVVSVTSPVLTVGMIFSTHCWHKDPHGLPWVEYHHEGKPKIWYAIPEKRSHKFRKTVEKLCPTVVQNKLLWLPSDLLMIPPDILIREGVSLTKTIQNPGEYIFVLPNAYTSSICTGYTVTESVYFAQESWLHDLHEVFLKLYKSCEPTMLPQEQLLISLATDPKTTPNVLEIIYSSLLSVLNAEKRNRSLLDSLGIVQEIFQTTDDYTRNWNSKEKECDICRAPFFFSKIVGRFKNQTLSKICIKHSEEIRECVLSQEWSITLVIYVSDGFINSLLDQFSNQLHI